MSGVRSRMGAAGLLLPLLLSGCLVSRRKLPVPKAPEIVQSASPADLVARLNKQWNAVQSLNATVEMKATVIKSAQGVSSEYPSIRGIILLRKPDMLRVFGRYPVVGTRMFDMISDGKTFTLWIRTPLMDEAIEGPVTESKTKSTNQFENLRPGFFFDAMVVHGLSFDDEYYVTADTDTMEDTAKKHLYLMPEYLLNIVRRMPGSHELAPARVVHFHRDDLLPYQQDLYDAEGNLQTQITYGRYVDFGPVRYPSTITIKRPLDGLKLVLTIEKVAENTALTDEEFHFTLPPGTDVKKLP